MILVRDKGHFDHILATYKEKEESFQLLFHSKFDPWSRRLLDLCEEEDVESTKLENLVVVDSFETPEIFSAFKVTKAPTLIISHTSYFSNKEDYLPSIYSKLLGNRS